MIKTSGDLGISLLHKLIVKIWQTGEWPEDWRRAVLIPIPKKGDLQQCSNYRTISLISHASKVVLKMFMKRIERKPEAEINVVQAGFRQGRGRNFVQPSMNSRDPEITVACRLAGCRVSIKLYAAEVALLKGYLSQAPI